LVKYDAENEESTLDGRFSYQPYGEPRVLNNDFSLSGESLWHDFDYLFAGYRYDDETGLYHTRARQYHPLLGVWTGRDPAGYVDGLNLYQYVAGSPTNFVDPSGEAISLLAVGGVALVGLLLMPRASDPQSEIGVSDEASQAFYDAHAEQTAREAALFASFVVPMGGATTLIGRASLGAGMNVAFHGLEDALTYSVTGKLNYVDEQGNFSPSAMATSYLESAVIGAVLPGVGTIFGHGARWTGQRVIAPGLRYTGRRFAGSGRYLSRVGEGLHIYGPGSVHLGMTGGGAADIIDRLVFAHRFARGRIVLRALNEGDVVSIAAGRGIRRGAGKTTPTQHVLGVDHPTDPWVSATRSSESALYFATRGGLQKASPIVAIDLHRLKRLIHDVSTYDRASRFLKHRKAIAFAASHREVLIHGGVEMMAIQRIVRI